jgi:hypothetical protein
VRRLRPAGLRAAIAVPAGVAALAAATVTAQAAPIARGIYLDRPESNRVAAGNLVYQRVTAAGATIARFTVFWRDVAPAKLPRTWQPRNPADPNYAWGEVDLKIRRAVANGLTPMVTILAAPRWAQGGTAADDLSSNRPSPAALAQFATAIARRYSGTFRDLPRVRYWQTWNEPNITAYLEPQWVNGRAASPDLYAQMLNAFADAIHAAAPGNVVISAGLTAFALDYRTVKSIGPLRFMRELLCMSGGAHPHPVCDRKVKFDIWAHHPYTSGGPFHRAARPDDVSLGDLPKMRTLLQAAVRAGHIISNGRVGFWVTEFSWDSKPPDRKGVPAALQARWTAEALHQMWLSGVTTVVWLMLRDDRYPGSPLQAGLYYRAGKVANDKPKPALTAFSFPFVAYLERKGISIWGETPRQRPGLIAVERQRAGSGGWQRVGTLRAHSGVFKGTVRVAAAPEDRLRARLLGTSLQSLAFSLTVPRDRPVKPFG